MAAQTVERLSVFFMSFRHWNRYRISYPLPKIRCCILPIIVWTQLPLIVVEESVSAAPFFFVAYHNSSIIIKMQNFQIILITEESNLQVQLPPFFTDYTLRTCDYISIKRSLLDMYDAYIRSEAYKSREWQGEHLLIAPFRNWNLEKINRWFCFVKLLIAPFRNWNKECLAPDLR